MPISSRLSFFYAEKGSLELNGHAVVLRQSENIIQFPVGAACAILIEPGTTVTHAAVKACADEGTLLLWVGEHGVRCYSAGNPGGANAEKILLQASIRLDKQKHFKSASRIFTHMFGESPPHFRSIEQLRGMEGAKVRNRYQSLAKEAGIEWKGRDATNALNTPLNLAISCGNAALYGLAEAVILALGYAPAIGMVHSGDPRSFVFDIADTVKFTTVVPMAMRLVKDSTESIEGRVRRACRDLFRESNMAELLIDIIERIMSDDINGI
ncbi:MAG: type I-E CRISPR-associated endonuclease Cas1 [Pseudomonadota bacterium]|nr:type I-E CRISPR-associated endonuclease Cas1 [Pseudomonadota bacterium]